MTGSVISYTPPSGFVGTDTFVYTVSDGFGGTGAGVVTVRIGELPVCDDVFTVLSQSADNVLDVLANDAIRPAFATEFSLLSAGGADAGGQVTVDNGVVLYSPSASHAGAYPYRETFRYLVEDNSMGTVTGKVSVIVYETGSDRADAVVHFNVKGVNDAPVISGTVAGQTVYYKLTVHPFSGVTIVDVDDQGQEPVWLTITLDDATHGILVSLGGFIDQGNGIYTLGVSGNGVTPAAATAALRQLEFLPTTDGRVSPGVSEMTRFTLQVEDGLAAPVTDSVTTVIARHGFIGKVTAEDGNTDDEYGFATAATRDLVAVGVPLDAHQGVLQAGSVYLLARNEGGPDAWGQIQKLNASDFTGLDNFGFSLAMNGDTIAVGARFAPAQGRDSGAVYIFQRREDNTNLWLQVQKIFPSDGAADDRFGTSLALEGDLLAVGSQRDDDLGDASGSVYLFRRGLTTPGVWSQMDKVLATEGNRDDFFGSS
ncbi:MAG TPA: Ig-like domain-containing protein, partial [Verrucomicrobiae bacterium]|nr:Ig-like domain-containing protein [Verrucomicrobiae bacterium]